MFIVAHCAIKSSFIFACFVNVVGCVFKGVDVVMYKRASLFEEVDCGWLFMMAEV